MQNICDGVPWINVSWENFTKIDLNIIFNSVHLFTFILRCFSFFVETKSHAWQTILFSRSFDPHEYGVQRLTVIR